VVPECLEVPEELQESLSNEGIEDVSDGEWYPTGAIVSMLETAGVDDAVVTADTIYPCQFDRGVLTGAARAFGANYISIVELEGCREDGSRACTCELSW